jgi:kynurenine formamidase
MGRLGHVGNLEAKAFYNGTTNDEIKHSNKLGIHNWANRMVGRGTLIDTFRYRQEKGRPVNPLSDEKYSLDDLKQALQAQAGELKPGSILLVRTGWMGAYLASTADEKRAMAPLNKLKSCGVDDSREMVAWLWDNRVAAIGTDCPAVEPWPWDFRQPGALHYRTLSLLGLPLGEQFVLDPLAADCAEDRRYEFMLVSVPLHLVGGIASPPNAVAIK